MRNPNDFSHVSQYPQGGPDVWQTFLILKITNKKHASWSKGLFSFSYKVDASLRAAFPPDVLIFSQTTNWRNTFGDSIHHHHTPFYFSHLFKQLLRSRLIKCRPHSHVVNKTRVNYSRTCNVSPVEHVAGCVFFSLSPYITMLRVRLVLYRTPWVIR